MKTVYLRFGLRGRLTTLRLRWRLRRSWLRWATTEQVVADAFTLFAWAAGERSRGRVLWTCRPDGSDIRRLAMPILDAAPRPADALPG